MSLFKFQEFWSNRCGANEQFDQNSIHKSNIDNAEDGREKLIVASHLGILRIFSIGKDVAPSNVTQQFADLPSLSYSDNDLLLETQFSQPILQVTSGLFLSGSSNRQLMLLHPKKISVYSVSSVSGVAEFGFSYNLLLIYEHELPKYAYNLVSGRFGHVQSRDFICVQSLDGCLMFFEQESASFVRSLAAFMLPTSFVYMSLSDAFLVQSGDWTLHSYRYQVLAISSSQKEEKAGATVRRISPDWTLDISQPVQQMSYVLNGDSSFVCVLCDTCLYVLRESGSIHWQKKLDQPALHLHAFWLSSPTANVFERSSDARLMLLLTTNQDSLWLYGERRLKWACSLPFRAVSTITLRLADGPLQSCLVLLGDAGELSVGCLGTSPSLEMVSSLHNRFAESTEFKRKGSKSGGRVPVDDQKPSSKLEFDQEMQRLRQVIANADTEFDRMLRVDTDEAAETKSDQDQSTDFDTGEKHVGPDDLTVYMTTGQAKVIVGQVMAHSADDEEVETSIRHWLARQLNPETISMFEFGVHLQTKSSSVADVQCFVGSVDSVQVRPDTFQWKLIEPNTTTDRLTVRVHFAANQMSFLNSQCISLVITYVGSKGSVQVVTIQQIIPLIMFCSSTTSAFAQENESLFKFALLANQSDLDLRNFFGDLTPSVNLFGVSADSTSWHRKQDDRSTNRIVIKCISGTVVESKPNKSTDEVDTETLFSNVIKEDLVLVQFGNIDRSGSSKYSHGDTLHRYEITLSGSELMATIYVLNHLLHTIQRLRLQQSKAIVKVEFGSNFLAMQEYFERIDRHLEARQRLQQNKSQLEDYCVQYRCINKRLLIKLKERNLTSLSNLDILLEMYYEKILACSRQILTTQHNLEDLAGECNQFAKLFVQIVQLTSTCDSNQAVEVRSLFEMHLLTSHCELEGWQEKAQQGLLHLLGEEGSKTMKVSESSGNDLNMLHNNFNLKRLIQMYFNKVMNNQTFSFKIESNEKISMIEESID